MPIRDLDSEQKLSATSQADEVAVCSGAGSGKTRVLVGRYLYLVNSGQISLSEIAAITFTNKAADQMKARIAQKALELSEQYPDTAALWHETAEKIHSAPISTIHAFCNNILRAYPVQAGVDPQFEILDDTSSSRFQAEALSGFLKSRLDEDPDHIGILVRALGFQGLRRILTQLLSRRVEVVKWLDVHGVPSPEILRSQYRQFILKNLESFETRLRDFHAIRPGEDSLSGMLPDILEGSVQIREMVENDRVDEASIREVIALTPPKLPSLNKKIKDAWTEQGISAEQVKGGLKEYLEFLDLVSSYYRQEKDITPVVVSCLIEEYVKLEEHFLRLKKSQSYLDHDDTLIETWRLLRRHADVCRKVSGSFKHVLVDEFQDTDSLQLDILRMIAGNSSAKLFTVGDPKQSIYRFRGADVAVFNAFTARPSVDFKPLKVNYRSTPAIIGFINHTFSRIMGRDDPENPFDAVYSDMKSYRKGNDRCSGVEIVVFDAGNADACRSLEGDYIAVKAEELRETYGYSYGQMAILLRKGTQTRRYEEAFLRRGIPFVNLAGGNPLASPEACDIANLLGWLSHPEDQALFTAVLLSPLCGLDADVLYGLRFSAGESGSLKDAFLSEDISREEWSRGKDTSRIREILGNLLAFRDRKTIRELLEMAFGETGYTLTLLADPLRGEMSLAILDLILRTADNFEAKGGKLREFASLLKSGELRTDSVETLEVRGDALSIITIHKAKGMEYKVVFLADSASRTRNDPHPFVFHDELGPGFSYRTLSGKTVRMMTSAVASELEKRKELAESKRLFYVACTRAEDYLFITGKKPSRNGDPGYEKDNWLGWLESALSLSPEGEPSPDSPGDMFTCRVITDHKEKKPDRRSDKWQSILDAGKDVPAPNLPADLLFPPVLPLRYSGKPETLSPTQVMDYLKCPALYLFKHIYHLNPVKPGEHGESLGFEYGLLAHRALERWDYHTGNLLPVIVDELAERELTRELRNSLKDHLGRFIGSDLCGMIAGAEELRKEEPFAFVHDDVLVRGKMDLKVRTGDRVMIIDFKTDASLPEDVEDLVHRYQVQMEIYALAVRYAEDILPSRLILHFLTPGLTRDIPCSEESIAGISQLLTKTIASLDAGDFSPNRTERCTFCSSYSLCRIF